MTQAPTIQEQIRSSFDRCQVQHRLSPASSHPVLRLQSTEVSERRERFLDAIGGFGPELDKATLLPDKGHYCLLISDSEGIVVEAYIPDGAQADFARFGIAVGGVWNEQIAGTNGVDMALRANRVLTVQGQDHFHRCFRDFACSSAPLHDAQDNLLGCITLVGTSQRRPDEIAWCEQVLRVAGSRLKAQLFRRTHNARITARLVSRSADRAKRFETMVACDDRGNIVSSVPLWRDGVAPAEHRQLEGLHLSDLRNFDVTVQGPSLVLPRRLVSIPISQPTATPLRARPLAVLARMAAHGGRMEVIVERARKLAAHRVPMLICGEPGVEKEAFARALVEDVLPNTPGVQCLDAARFASVEDLDGALRQLRFLSEYPVDRVPPVMILLSVDRLGPGPRLALQDFLEDLERESQGGGRMAQRPLLLMTMQRDWREVLGEATADGSLLFLTGQSVVTLPPLRDRDLAKVLDAVLASDFADGPDLSEPARARLCGHDWPGNLREMRAVLREAAICGNGQRINLVDLPPRLVAVAPKVSGEGLRQTLIDALDSTNWNVTRAAALLGKSRATVNRWIAEQGLSRPG